jgi:DNA-binding protein Fis
MSAPTKPLFDVDFSRGPKRQTTVTLTEHATKLAEAETSAHCRGCAQGKADEAEPRVAAALERIAGGLAAAGTALKTIEALFECEVVEVVAPVAHAALAAEQVSRALVGRTVAEVERDLILETLRHCLGNRTHAANVLGISIRTLRNKLNEYAARGVPVPPPGGGEPRAAAYPAFGAGGTDCAAVPAPASQNFR